MQIADGNKDDTKKPSRKSRLFQDWPSYNMIGLDEEARQANYVKFTLKLEVDRERVEI